MSQLYFPPFPECPKAPTTPTMTPPSTTTISSDGIVSNPLGEIDLALATDLLEFQDLQNQIEEQRHRHPGDVDFQAMLDSLASNPSFPSSPINRLIAPIPRSAIACSLGTTIQSTPAISFPLWAQPTYVTNQREERMAPSIFKVNIIQRVVC